jgi:serine/threonine protein kinase
LSFESEKYAGRSVPLPGERIGGKYEVERILGQGGMGVVVAARHIQIGQRVAIKFLRGYAAADPNATERFLREARAAVVLTSEHATKVLDVGTDESGEPYMVMEYLAGSDLTALLQQRGSLGVHETVDIVLQACEAIAEAHARGIVHRDLKPPNLFVTKGNDGRRLVKVLDFGISKTLDTQPSQDLTASGSLMGSPAYMSPEQVRAPKTVDARTDVWALGVVLFELLTGKCPFIGETMGETLARIIADATPSIRDLRPELPAGLDIVVARCLERDMSRRIQSVADLASMLLPFGPREAEASVERIVRIGAATSGLRTDGLAAPDVTGLSSEGGKDAGNLPGGRVPTATANEWQTSGLANRASGRRVFGRTGVVAVAGLVVVATGIASFALRGSSGDDTHGRAKVEPSVAHAAGSSPPSGVQAAIPSPTPPLASPSPDIPSDPEVAAEVPEAGSRPTTPTFVRETPTRREVPAWTPLAPRKKAALPPAPSSTSNEKDIF